MSSQDEEVPTNNHMGYFGVESSSLIDLVEAYRNRKFDEDLTYVDEKFSDLEKLADKLKSSLANGLEGNDFQKRDEHFGSNEKEPPPRKGICKLFLEALDDLMLKILIVSAIISIIISMIFADDDERPIAWVEGGAILFAVAVVTGVTAWNDYQKEKQFMKLTEYSDSQNNFTVLRNGIQEEINFDDIKVGDLIAIKTGMNIPADAILIRGTGVTSDESAIARNIK